MPSESIGCIHKGQVGERWSPREKAPRYDPEDKCVIPEDQNITLGHISNSRRNQPKKNSHLLSRESDYCR